MRQIRLRQGAVDGTDLLDQTAGHGAIPDEFDLIRRFSTG